MAQAAWATEGAHFFSATSSIDNNGALEVNFDEAGVGQQLMNYTLNAVSSTHASMAGGTTPRLRTMPRVVSSRAPGTRYLGRDDGGGAPVASAGSDSRPSLSPIAPGATYEAGLAHVEGHVRASGV